MYISKIRNFFSLARRNFSKIYQNIKIQFLFLKENNLAQALDYFELGILDECKNRLKIMTKMWPDDEYVKYLLSIVLLLNRDRYSAIKLLNSIKDYKPYITDKLIKLLEQDRILKIIRVYEDTHDLIKVENEIEAIQI